MTGWRDPGPAGDGGAYAEAGPRNGTDADVPTPAAVEERICRTEAAARQQGLELEAVYSTAPIGLCVLDTELRFRRINERLAEINGLPAAAHFGRTVREVVPALADMAEPLFRRVIATGEPLLDIEVSGETQARPGARRVWRESYYPLKDPTGQVLGINVMVEEITGQKRLEEEIRALNADLEARVSARTAEVCAANAVKSRFLATFTHELRTPLHAILGFTQVLERLLTTPAAEQDAQRRQDLLDAITRNGRHLLALVNDILDLSRMESGLLRLNAVPTHLARLLPECLADLAPLAAEKGLALHLDTTPQLPDWVAVDRVRLTQILANLLGNAIKYTRQGEIRLGASGIVEAADPECLTLTFTVTDTGPGFAAADREALFSPLAQAGKLPVGNASSGSGLGLPLCRELVRLMGGAIHLDSTPGRGSRFTLSFPGVPVVKPMEAPSTAGVESGPTPSFTPDGHGGPSRPPGPPEAPPPAALEELRQLALQRRTSRLVAWCRQWSGPHGYPAFAASVHDRTLAFDYDQIVALAEKALQPARAAHPDGPGA